MNSYDDIINLPHHESLTHPKMSMENRAAQFAPFAALTGHKEAIEETGRLTDEKIDVSDTLKEILNEKLNILESNNNIEVTVRYFIPDKIKSGGKYVSKTGIIRKIDKYNKNIIFEDKTKISIEEIISIDIKNYD